MANFNIAVTVLIFSALFTSMPRGCNCNADQQTQSAPFVETKVVRGKVKVTELHFYVQDIAGGPNPTVYEVAQASITANSPSRFGQVKVMDHVMTTGTAQNSTEVGRVQGLITAADLAVMGFATNLNFYFTYGKYNGSTISIVGRNQISEASRELIVVGGTGLFRFSTGYALSSTYSYDAATSHTVIEYTLYVKSISASLKSSRNFL